jgi:signal peptidase I
MIAAVFFLIYLFLFSSAFSKSLWDNGFNVYKVYINPGDIVQIKFSEKTVLKYRLEERQNNYQAKKGRKGEGDLFNFFPSAAVNENDTVRNQNTVSVNNENQFVIPARVKSVENNTVMIEGVNNSLINGEYFKIEIGGECSLSAIKPDGFIHSTDIYNLDFKIYRESPTNTAFFNENDLSFQSNYTEILTNQVYDTNSRLTNTVLTTNFSSVKMEFKGLKDSKKKEIILNYLNFIIHSLFR